MPRLFMFVVIVFVYNIVVAQNILFFGNIVGNLTKNIGKISTHTPFPILLSIETWKIKTKKKFNTITFFFENNQNFIQKIFWFKKDQKKNKQNKAQKKINLWEFCAHPKKWATNKKKLGWCHILLQGFLLFWKYKRTNHKKRNYLKKLTKNYYEELSKIME